MRVNLPLWALGLIIVLVSAPLLWLLNDARQETADQKARLDEQQLVERVKQAVMNELHNEEFLDDQIALGIQDYIKKQRQDRVTARAEKQRLASEKTKHVRRVSSTRDHIFGNPDAAISLIEYSDFECPFCKRFHSTAKDVVQAYGGQVNWVYRHFPLYFHNPGAQKQAEASECANDLGGGNAFWKYTDAIYARTRSNGKGFAVTKLVPLATEIGLDAKQFYECLESGKFAARVEEDIVEGRQIGITGTPGNILLHNQTGETRFKSGAQPLAAFKVDIDAMLNGTARKKDGS